MLINPTKADSLASFVQVNTAVYESASTLAVHTINNSMSLSLLVLERVGSQLLTYCKQRIASFLNPLLLLPQSESVYGSMASHSGSQPFI